MIIADGSQHPGVASGMSGIEDPPELSVLRQPINFVDQQGWVPFLTARNTVDGVTFDALSGRQTTAPSSSRTRLLAQRNTGETMVSSGQILNSSKVYVSSVHSDKIVAPWGGSIT